MKFNLSIVVLLVLAGEDLAVVDEVSVVVVFLTTGLVANIDGLLCFSHGQFLGGIPYYLVVADFQ